VDSVFHHGRVGINTDQPDEALTVYGNLRLTGALLQPSDERLKQDLQPVDTSQSLRILSAMQLFHFRFRPEYEQKLCLDSNQPRIGVIAQQLRRLLPDAVKECRSWFEQEDVKLTKEFDSSASMTDSSLLMVDKERLLMECVAALQQLHLQQSQMQKKFQRLQTRLQLLQKMATKWLPMSFILTASIVFLLLLVAQQYFWFS
jgi:hypothetical protein